MIVKKKNREIWIIETKGGKSAVNKIYKTIFDEVASIGEMTRN